MHFLLSYLGYWGNLGIKCACCKVKIDIHLLPCAAQSTMDIKETERVKHVYSEWRREGERREGSLLSGDFCCLLRVRVAGCVEHKLIFHDHLGGY